MTIKKLISKKQFNDDLPEIYKRIERKMDNRANNNQLGESVENKVDKPDIPEDHNVDSPNSEEKFIDVRGSSGFFPQSPSSFTAMDNAINGNNFITKAWSSVKNRYKTEEEIADAYQINELRERLRFQKIEHLR